MDEWIRAHVVEVPRQTHEFCGDLLAGARVLDVGCGEMLSDFGLLDLGPARITGLDVHPKVADWRDTVAAKVRANGHEIATDYAERLDFVAYDGTNFPFADASFDAVFSWSAFEHVADVGAVLREMHRVLTPEGRAFVQVYPWFPSRPGSHLTDWIAQPFFHLRQNDGWVEAALRRRADADPSVDRAFVIGHMLGEYRTLNRITASDFYAAARASGFVVTRARACSYDEDLSDAPDGVPFSELMMRGTMMLMRKGGGFRAG